MYERHPNADWPVEFIPHAPLEFSEWQMARMSLHQRHALMQRGLTSRSRDELQMLVQMFGDQ